MEKRDDLVNNASTSNSAADKPTDSSSDLFNRVKDLQKKSNPEPHVTSRTISSPKEVQHFSTATPHLVKPDTRSSTSETSSTDESFPDDLASFEQTKRVLSAITIPPASAPPKPTRTSSEEWKYSHKRFFLAFLLLAIVVGGVFFGDSITGLFVRDSSLIAGSFDLNESYSIGSYSIPLNISSRGQLKSLKVYGSAVNNPNFTITLRAGDEIFSVVSSSSFSGSSLAGITGFVVANVGGGSNSSVNESANVSSGNSSDPAEPAAGNATLNVSTSSTSTNSTDNSTSNSSNTSSVEVSNSSVVSNSSTSSQAANSSNTSSVETTSINSSIDANASTSSNVSSSSNLSSTSNSSSPSNSSSTTNTSTVSNATSSNSTLVNESTPSVSNETVEGFDDYIISGACDDTCLMYLDLNQNLTVEIKVREGTLNVDSLVYVHRESVIVRSTPVVRDRYGGGVQAKVLVRDSSRTIALAESDALPVGSYDLIIIPKHRLISQIVLQNVSVTQVISDVAKEIGALTIDENMSTGGVAVLPLVPYDSIEVYTDVYATQLCEDWNLQGQFCEDDTTEIPNLQFYSTSSTLPFALLGAARDVEAVKVREDSRYDLIIGSQELINGDLVIEFYHDGYESLPVRFKGRKVNFTLSHKNLGPYDTGTLIIRNYHESQKFKLKVGRQSEIVEFGEFDDAQILSNITGADGSEVNASVIYFDEDFEEFVDPAGKAVEEGVYTVTIEPDESLIHEVEIHGAILEGVVPELIKIGEDVNGSSNDELAISTYSIDPTTLEFDYANVTITASGTALYKCAAWNFTVQECQPIEVNCSFTEDGDDIECDEIGGWELLDSTILPGQNYTIRLTPDDPGFAEFNESSSQSSTSSTSYQTKLEERVTPLVQADYLILGSLLLHSSSRSYSVSSQMTFDGTSVMETSTEPKDGNIARDYQPQATQFVSSLTPSGHDVKLNWKSENAAAVAYAKDAAVSFIELGEYNYSESLAEQSTTTADTTYHTHTFTPLTAGDYLILASGEFQTGSTSKSLAVSFDIDSNQVAEIESEAKDSTDYRSFIFQNVTFLDNSSHTLKLRASEESSTSGNVRKLRTTAILLDEDFGHYSTQSVGLSDTSSPSYVNKATLTFTPEEQADYLFIATAELGQSSTSDQVNAILEIDGDAYCETIIEPKEADEPLDFLPFFCQKNVTMSADSHTVNIRYKKQNSNTAYIRNAKITALKRSPVASVNLSVGPVILTPIKVREDLEVDVAISQELIDGDLVLNVSHDSSSDLDVKLKSPDQNYLVTNSTLTGNTTGTIVIYNYTSSKGFQLKVGESELYEIGNLSNASIDIEVKNSSGGSVSVVANYYDEILNEVVPLASGVIDTGTYTVNLTPQSDVVRHVEMRGAIITSNVSELLRIEENVPPQSGLADAVQLFSVDPEMTNFTNATVTITATGHSLYKCQEWNFTTQNCYGSWALFKEGLVPGENYTFILSPDDPGFGEINITRAEHLDENYSHISDVYDAARHFDNSWTEKIFENEFVRVSFDSNITNDNVIYVYARGDPSSATYFEVYQENTTSPLIGRSVGYNGSTNHIEDENWYQVDVENLDHPQSDFDFKIISPGPQTGWVEFDYIEDPAPTATTCYAVHGAYENITGYGDARTFDNVTFVLSDTGNILKSEYKWKAGGVGFEAPPSNTNWNRFNDKKDAEGDPSTFFTDVYENKTRLSGFIHVSADSKDKRGDGELNWTLYEYKNGTVLSKIASSTWDGTGADDPVDSNASISNYTVEAGHRLMLNITGRLDAVPMSGGGEIKFKLDELGAETATDVTTNWCSSIHTTYKSFVVLVLTEQIIDAVDPIPPVVTILGPANASYDGNGMINFRFNVTDDSPILNCSVFLDGVIIASNLSVTRNITSTIVGSGISNGTHEWNVSCTDNGGSTGTSATFLINVTLSAGPIQLLTITETFKDAGGGLVNGSIELIDSSSGESDVITTSGGSANFSTGVYDIKVRPDVPGSPELIFSGATIVSNVSNVTGFDISLELPAFVNQLAVRPILDPASGVTDVNISGSTTTGDMFFCLGYNFTAQFCPDNNWKKLTSVGAGENYSFSFPSNQSIAFAETNLTVNLLDANNMFSPANVTELSSSGSFVEVLIVPNSTNKINNLTIRAHSVLNISNDLIASILHNDTGWADNLIVDPRPLNFSNATLFVTAAATSTSLWKCVNYNFSDEDCEGDMVHITNLTPGQVYELFVNATDPIFFEQPDGLEGNDSQVVENNPDTNYASNRQIRVDQRNNRERRAALAFNLTGIPPDALVSNAILTLTKYNGAGTLSIDVVRINSSWSEPTITWNNQPTNDSFVFNTTLTSGNADYEFNVTDLAQLWINGTFQNLGMFLIPSDPGGSSVRHRFRSSDYGANPQDRPSLNITFFDPPPKVIDLIPAANTTFNTSEIIEIGANVTDLGGVDTVFANVTFPNSSSFIIPLALAVGDIYNASFTIPVLVGNYTVEIFANDSSNNINFTESTNFIAVEPFVPVLAFTATLPGQAPVLANDSGNATAIMYFNSNVTNSFGVDPCVGLSSNCQNSTLPFFIYTNTGNIDVNLSVELNQSLPPQFNLSINRVANPSNSSPITTTTQFYATLLPNETEPAFFYGGFINAQPQHNTNRTLYSNGSAAGT
jgi:hypothetical protein